MISYIHTLTHLNEDVHREYKRTYIKIKNIRKFRGVFIDLLVKSLKIIFQKISLSSPVTVNALSYIDVRFLPNFLFDIV